MHNRNHRDLRRVDNAIDGKIAQIGYGKFPRAVHLTIAAQQRKVFQHRDGLQNALNNAVGGGLVVLCDIRADVVQISFSLTRKLNIQF